MTLHEVRCLNYQYLAFHGIWSAFDLLFGQWELCKVNVVPGLNSVNPLFGECREPFSSATEGEVEDLGLSPFSFSWLMSLEIVPVLTCSSILACTMKCLADRWHFVTPRWPGVGA